VDDRLRYATIIKSSVNIESEITNQITKDLSDRICNWLEVVKSYLTAGFRLPQ